MFSRFNVKNFLSFNQLDDCSPHEFSMISGKVKNKESHLINTGKMNLLKFSSIYGANAAGKSNLIKAMKFFKDTITNGLPSGHTEMYCKTNLDNKDKASYFEIEIAMNGKYYAYGFEIILNQSKFVSEWLVELLPNSQKEIFTRNIINGEYHLKKYKSETELNSKLKVYASDIKNDTSALFLVVMNQNKKNLYVDFPSIEILNEIYTWIVNNLKIHFPNQPISSFDYMSDIKKVDQASQLMKAFGTGITNFEMVDIDIEQALSRIPNDLAKNIIKDIEKMKNKINENKDQTISLGIMIRSQKKFFTIRVSKEDIKCQTTEFHHSNHNMLYKLAEESDGTIRLLDLLEVLLTTKNATFIIDEIDRCLHPELSYKFIETFLEISKERNIQLIVTTHESRLLNLDMLRRDEIWFTEKNNMGESKIYSLEEYNERFDRKIEKSYLEGRYGGIPLFDPIMLKMED